MKNWKHYNENTAKEKQMAAKVIAHSVSVCEDIKDKENAKMKQLLQKLVMLQSQKVKAKLMHLESMYSMIEKEKSEIKILKNELFRFQIENARLRTQILNSNANTNNQFYNHSNVTHSFMHNNNPQ